MGVYGFAENPHAIIALKKHTTKVSLTTAVSNIQFDLHSGTHIGRALRYVHDHVFVPEAEDRLDAQDILVVITDGQTHKKCHL